MMKKNKKHWLLSSVLALAIVFNSVLPIGAVEPNNPSAPETVTTGQVEPSDIPVPEKENDDAKKDNPDAGAEEVNNQASSAQPEEAVADTQNRGTADVSPSALMVPLDAPTEGENRSNLLKSPVIGYRYEDGNREEIPAKGPIDRTRPIKLTISFGVPVEATAAEGEQIVHKGDYAVFEIDDKFKLMTNTNENLMFGGLKLGTLHSDATSTYVVFDGADSIFNGEDLSIENVKGEISLSLKFDESSVDYGDVDEEGISLIKVGDFESPKIPISEQKTTIDLSVVKTGEVTSKADRTVTWTVKLSALTKYYDGHTKKLSLAGMEFFDDLAANGKDAGEYVDGSFKIDGDTISPQPTVSDNQILYTFPQDYLDSEAVVTFETKFPETAQYVGWNGYNKAGLRTTDEDDQPIEKTDDEPVTIQPFKWFEKTGKLTSSGWNDTKTEYDPENREITWTIIANHEGASLDNVVITDLTQKTGSKMEFVSATLEKVEKVEGVWNSTGMIEDYNEEPSNGKYKIASVNTPIRLTIVTKVTDTSPTGTFNVNNDAEITWDGLGDYNPDGKYVGNDSVSVGYAAIDKKGELIDKKSERSVKWTVTVKPGNQSNLNQLKVYDLLIHRGSFTAEIESRLLVLGLSQSEINTLKEKYQNNNNVYQKYAGEFVDIGNVGLSDNVQPIYDGNGNLLADLLTVTGFTTTVDQSFSFETTVTNPEIYAANAEKTVYNTAFLYNGTDYRGKASNNVKYNTNLLSKEVLDRAALDADKNITDPNQDTKDANKAFDYQDKSVIFRLSINADGLDLSSDGKVTVTDLLPQGWELAEIESGKDFLIYEGETKAVGSKVVKAKLPLTEATGVVGFAKSTYDAASRQKLEFVFADGLGKDETYVILIKAKPTEATLKTYFSDNQNIPTIKNDLTLQAEDWPDDRKLTADQNVQISRTILDKKMEAPYGGYAGVDGAVKWTVEYKPYNLDIKGKVITDKLPEGLDMRTDSKGNLIFEDNISVQELELKADGSYVEVGEPLDIEELKQVITYNLKDRELKFEIPESNQAYRFVYMTDYTGEEGANLFNEVRLDGTGSAHDTSKKVPFNIQYANASAYLERSGWVEIQKTNGATGQSLDGAEFAIFTTNNDGEATDTVFRSGITVANEGKLILRGLAVGEYILKETKTAGPQFVLDGTEYRIVVTQEGGEGRIVTAVDEKTGANSNKIKVANYPVGTAGHLTVGKTVTSYDNDTSGEFNFTLALESNNTATYRYKKTTATGDMTGELLPNANGQYTFTLKHNENLTVLNIPKDTKYTVTESADVRYNTEFTVNGDNEDTASGTIAADETQEVEFINTKRELGSLEISKTVVGDAEPNQKFGFTVHFLNANNSANEDSYQLQGVEGKTTIKSGDKINLGNGETATINYIPKNIKYTVTEDSTNGFKTHVNGQAEESNTAAGTIAADDTQEVAFTNTVLQYHNLTIEKQVIGDLLDSDYTRQFNFAVTFDGRGKDGTYNYEKTVGDVTTTGTVSNSNNTFTLAHGETVVIKDLPEGTTYVVTEDDYTGEDYETEVVNGTGEITTQDGKTVSFTNDKKTASLVITKSVSGNAADENRKFEFTVEFRNSNGDLNETAYPASGVEGITEVKSGDNIYLAHNESLAIVGLPNGATYTITETDYSDEGYVVTAEDNMGTLVKEEIATASFVNTKDVGSLTIHKTVSGNAADDQKKFAFTVEFNAVGEYAYTGVGVEDGTIRSGDVIELAHGESITIHGLPQDATYNVTEEDYSNDGYVTETTGNEGIIDKDIPAEAEFINTRYSASLKIQKTVTGVVLPSDYEVPFDFAIAFGGRGAEQTYNYEKTLANGEKVTGTISNEENTFTLAHDESIEIYDVWAGTTYEVTETPHDGYYTAYPTLNGEITDVDTVVNFNNVKETGNLLITKMVEGKSADQTKKFDFTVEFDAEGEYAYTGVGVANGTLKSGNQVSLAHGQSITINGLPEGTKYKVSEADYSAEHYTMTAENAEGTIVDKAVSSAKFVNAKKVGDLKIEKTVAGSGADKDKKFDFTVKFDAKGEFAYIGTGVENGTLKSGDKISLANGQSITVQNLPADVEYTVTEADYTKEGYTAKATNASGKISDAETKTASFVNTKDSKKTTTTPQTGDNGQMGAWLVGLGVSSLALVTLLMMKKRSAPTGRRYRKNS
ncbi:prealbumin-like fold domain-containing protein [Scatolibacter rhodanostii]|uniref:prealbumin-like fold domain-containing protein n=1 Tax=Scatolibacter rhodanostii TaxID=2014781 RepID=UPI000C06AECB|nr:DUF5979 domain-containing protein [Scatolibacter rhodanostii]